MLQSNNRFEADGVWRTRMRFYSFQIVVEKEPEDEGYFAGWRPDGLGRAEWRDAGFSPRRKGTDLPLPQPDYPLTLTSLSPGERVSRLYRDG